MQFGDRDRSKISTVSGKQNCNDFEEQRSEQSRVGRRRIPSKCESPIGVKRARRRIKKIEEAVPSLIRLFILHLHLHLYHCFSTNILHHALAINPMIRLELRCYAQLVIASLDWDGLR